MVCSPCPACDLVGTYVIRSGRRRLGKPKRRRTNSSVSDSAWKRSTQASTTNGVAGRGIRTVMPTVTSWHASGTYTTDPVAHEDTNHRPRHTHTMVHRRMGSGGRHTTVGMEHRLHSQVVVHGVARQLSMGSGKVMAHLVHRNNHGSSNSSNSSSNITIHQGKQEAACRLQAGSREALTSPTTRYACAWVWVCRWMTSRRRDTLCVVTWDATVSERSHRGCT